MTRKGKQAGSASGDPVRDQYEDYPYPSRDPAEEAKRLIEGSPSHLLEIDHYLFAGRGDFGQGFHALVAGGGTGDGAIMLAQHLATAGKGGRVTYLDLAETTAGIARARAQARGLKNIDFITGSLLEVAELAPGPYDYIDCCGVLHHLRQPEEGLAALHSVLKPGGGMGIMLYGEYGRLGIYPMQAMLRSLGRDRPLPERIVQARRLIAALPPTHGFVLNRNLGDYKRGDAELVDLLLHPVDRAYRVEEVYELVSTQPDLSLVSFIEPIFYRPETYLKDRELLEPLAGLADAQREAFAEQLAGNRKTHVFYLTSRAEREEAVAAWDDRAMIPVMRDGNAKGLAASLAGRETLPMRHLGIAFEWAVPRAAEAILKSIDGKRSLGDIHKAMRAGNKALTWEKFLALYGPLFDLLNGLNLLFHRRPKVRR